MSQPGRPTAGVLQIPVTATQKSASKSAKKTPKPPAQRLKLLIRRLPPGFTQTEFDTALGDEWKVGAGKVDWLQYKPGKVSKEWVTRARTTVTIWKTANQRTHARSPAKPSRPSRAYIHVVSSEHITPLSDRVRQASFQDTRQTWNDPVLLGPPSVEFAPYAKTPGGRVRKDARQGTIDQDPDFIAFLESLTQPITKPAAMDSTETEEKMDAVTTTPLVQYIKDKKASKAKESGNSKSKHRAEKESKQEKVQAKKLLQRPDKDAGPASTAEKKGKGDKASKESAKAGKQLAATTKSGKTSAASTPKESISAAGSERKRERGNVAAAAKILQRDLGIASSNGRRRGKGGSGSNETGSPKNESSRDSSVPGPTTTESSKKETTKPAKGDSSTKAKDVGSSSSRTSDAATPPTSTPATSNASTKPPKGVTAKAAATPGPTSTQAFLKHANPSQGVTEVLLEEAFGVFGAVTKVEIDKKKGFGYVDFAAPEGLRNAMAASPVTVGQSQVVVLERKANPGGEKSRKGRERNVNKTKEIAPTAAANPAATAGGSGGGNAGSSRGSRGGRGNRNKGPKGEAKEGKEKAPKPE
ncbi:hypothetical protein N7532_004882 [Penicillium argentinense]|uniref:RRM domain-containing protein n=1 Tax=Penicillium argentinense TaxID=1131581 RepID=A0A9W9FCU4_9EURO|nr:uncharacterized protein N7532_004882 [Penicillium argentinense]KAJ5097881.1 hypothetical protein N7532_004882 [Penicillium argentinense]